MLVSFSGAAELGSGSETKRVEVGDKLKEGHSRGGNSLSKTSEARERSLKNL